MKMIMSLKSPEAGNVSHALSAGSIVSAGELLAKLELKDPSKAAHAGWDLWMMWVEHLVKHIGLRVKNVWFNMVYCGLV